MKQDCIKFKMSKSEKTNIKYDKCICYRKGNCGANTRLNVNGMYSTTELNEDVQNHLVDIKVIKTYIIYPRIVAKIIKKGINLFFKLLCISV